MVTMLDLEQLAESGELFDGHYKLMYPLNTDGATADIWLAVDTNTVDDDESDNMDEEQGLKVAIKIYRPQNALDIEGVQRFRNEFKVVFNCQHSNLLHPVHFSLYKETPYLVLPYCQNGSTEFISGQMQRDEDIWKFINDVASGLNYLHTNNPPIVHQDIKPANILIDDNRNYTITDFGISISRKNRLHGNEENSGTLAYMAPERFEEGIDPMPESDIWALGATLYELITGKVPFGENGGNCQMDEIPSLNFPKNTCSKKVQKLILKCLSKTSQNRPTAKELIELAKKNYNAAPIKLAPKVIWSICGLMILVVILGSLYLIVGSSENTAKENAERDASSSVLSQTSKPVVQHPRQSQLEGKRSTIIMYEDLDEKPTFYGGDKELCNYLSQAINFQSRSETDKFISVSFVVNKDGSINDDITIKNANPNLERNINIAIQNMPNWIPGKQKGAFVPVMVHFYFLMKKTVHLKTSLSPNIYELDFND